MVTLINVKSFFLFSFFLSINGVTIALEVSLYYLEKLKCKFFCKFTFGTWTYFFGKTL